MEKFLDEMEFPFLRIDLAKNYVHGIKIVRLQYLSMAVFIGDIFAKSCVLSEIESLKQKYSKVEEVLYLLRKRWNDIEEKVIEEIESLIPLKTLIRPMVSLVSKEILELLIKSVVYFDDESLFLNNLVFNSQGKINTLGTIVEILDKPDLSAFNKYLFACKYFLGKEKIIHYKKASQWELSGGLFTEDGRVSMYFWLWYINDKNDFEEEIKKCFKKIGLEFTFDGIFDSAKKCIFKWALEIGNETAIQCIYDKFISNNPEKEEILNDEFDNERKFRYDETNVILYLISQVNKEELPIWPRKLMVDGLKKMMKQSKFHNSFLKLLKSVKHRFKNFHYLTLLDEILKVSFDVSLTGSKINHYENLTKAYISCIPDFVKIHLVQERPMDYESLLKYSFSNRNFEITCSLIEISNKYTKEEQFLKRFVYATDASFFNMAICEDDTNFIDRILNRYLKTETNVSKIKSYIFNKYEYKKRNNRL